MMPRFLAFVKHPKQGLEKCSRLLNVRGIIEAWMSEQRQREWGVTPDQAEDVMRKWGQWISEDVMPAEEPTFVRVYLKCCCCPEQHKQFAAVHSLTPPCALSVRASAAPVAVARRHRRWAGSSTRTTTLRILLPWTPRRAHASRRSRPDLERSATARLTSTSRAYRGRSHPAWRSMLTSARCLSLNAGCVHSVMCSSSKRRKANSSLRSTAQSAGESVYMSPPLRYVVGTVCARWSGQQQLQSQLLLLMPLRVRAQAPHSTAGSCTTAAERARRQCRRSSRQKTPGRLACWT
jgi:hypothetical protein